MPYGDGMEEEIKVKIITYARQVKPPTRDQFLYRRAVRETMKAIKGKVGVTVNPGTGIPIPESALAAKEALKGLTAEKIAKEHPEWLDEYNKGHGKGE